MRVLATFVAVAFVAQPPTDADCLLNDDVECPEFDPVDEPEAEEEALDSEALMDCWAAGLCDYPDDAPDSRKTAEDDLVEESPRAAVVEALQPQTTYIPANRKKVVTGAVLMGVGMAVVIGGAVLIGVGIGPGPAPGPNCTTGKPCGQTCIELSDTCHIGATGGDYQEPNPVLIGTGGVVIAVGVGILIGGVYTFHKGRSRLVVTATPTGLAVNF